MHRHLNRNVALFLGLALPAVFTLAGTALAGEALPDRPGFGYAIQFSPGNGASLVPAPAQEDMIVRPGFGYTINFVTGDPANSLFPPGWVQQRALAEPPQG